MSLLDTYGLRGWFENSFNSDEKSRLRDKYPDFEAAESMNIDSAAYVLAFSLSFYNTKNNADICVKVIEKIEALLQVETIAPCDAHFLYMQLINTCYKLRDIDGYEYKAIYYCNKQIEIAPQVIGTFSIIPEHTGYKQLCIIEKKDKNWQRVKELATAAASQGWAGDWAARIAEAEKHI